ncbi:2-amino-4-hydroxy-6-hydroxymethyldihydropteridine diphosphokinase [Aquimarina agarilytica]|uniref:2-amino-4-hydroxy-6- hydroxymethyldihydropteridine diphosphokinase n=1 Tax=Aquimarina agarilytica TaxID=1087449 RepID=UPI000288E8FA|nr:2-amino-4-hydroxy-6-hydroxymethyldihydropteridine diphosphokinase [Aquimarina agarilytica]
MKTKKPIIELIISLGSNIAPRFEHLQEAVVLIKKKIGTVHASSFIYETPAWGFISTPFLNACITIKTSLNTKNALIVLQEIEKDLGRKPKIGPAYEARPIDLDILFSSEGIFNYESLTVPHPLLHERKFVLIPLLDIAPNYAHPLLHKTTQQLLKTCHDSSEITPTKHQLT